jgi:hypothetical protein
MRDGAVHVVGTKRELLWEKQRASFCSLFCFVQVLASSGQVVPGAGTSTTQHIVMM